MSTNEHLERYADIKNKLAEYASRDSAILAVIVIGSSTRTDLPADKYSDLDLIIVTEEPEIWYSGEYQAKLGTVSVSFIEPTLGGGRERRCIYDADKDVDFLIYTHEQFEKALSEGTMSCVMDRGYEFLCDRGGFAELARRCVKPVIHRPQMFEEDFANTVGTFYFHIIWAYKKLLRGELWSAVICVDSYLKELLLKMIEQYHIVTYDTDVWHDGRFLDRWADASVLDKLEECFSRYDKEDCKKALTSTHELFAVLAKAVAEKRGFAYPTEYEACASEFMKNGF